MTEFVGYVTVEMRLVSFITHVVVEDLLHGCIESVWTGGDAQNRFFLSTKTLRSSIDVKCATMFTSFLMLKMRL
jgi:hypothetical protein